MSAEEDLEEYTASAEQHDDIKDSEQKKYAICSITRRPVLCRSV